MSGDGVTFVVVRSSGERVEITGAGLLYQWAADHRLLAGDSLILPGATEPVPVRSIPALRRLIPSREELLAARSITALTMFCGVLLPVLGLMVLALLFSRGPHDGSAAKLCGVMLVFAAAFVAPLILLRLRKSALFRARVEGVEPAEVCSSDSPPRRVPPATAILAALLPFCFILQHLLGPETVATLVKSNAELAAGELWRLFSAIFVHNSLSHVAANTGALVAIGRRFEPRFGAPRLAVTFLLGGVAGFVLSALLDGRSSAGASGGVFALAAAVVLLEVDLWRARRPHPGGELLLVVLPTLVLYSVLTPEVDHAAHLGGALAGCALHWRSVRPRQLFGRRHTKNS